jgi:hypothetical protein
MFLYTPDITSRKPGKEAPPGRYAAHQNQNSDAELEVLTEEVRRGQVELDLGMVPCALRAGGDCRLADGPPEQ